MSRPLFVLSSVFLGVLGLLAVRSPADTKPAGPLAPRGTGHVQGRQGLQGRTGRLRAGRGRSRGDGLRRGRPAVRRRDARLSQRRRRHRRHHLRPHQAARRPRRRRLLRDEHRLRRRPALPTGVMPWHGGLLVANAPDIALSRRHRRTTGKADRQTRALHRLRPRQHPAADQQPAMGPGQLGLRLRRRRRRHHHVAREAGHAAGRRCAAAAFAFIPTCPAAWSRPPAAGSTAWPPTTGGHWFTATNSQHLRHIVLPDHYLRRNPLLPVVAVTLDIPDHGAACKVYPHQPVRGVARRADHAPQATAPTPAASRRRSWCPAATSPRRAARSSTPPTCFRTDYRGNTFVCDPANNLIHRDVLVPNGATFTAKRGDADCEFLASTDNWFRPVHLTSARTARSTSSISTAR